MTTTVSQMRAIASTLVATTLTKARLAGLLALGGVGVLLGIALGLADLGNRTATGADLINAFGLAILAPVVTLVVASATLGDPLEDQTLVYFWLRPVSRAAIAASAGLAALVIAGPIVLVPLLVAAAFTGGGGSLVIATAAAATLAVVGYLGLFVLLGTISKRPLQWGVLYILIWEGFIARAGTSSSQFSIQYYARSALADIADVSLRLADAALPAAVLAPVAATVVALGVVTYRLRHLNVA
jgi:ABC-2 type transport system permease protein